VYCQDEIFLCVIPAVLSRAHTLGAIGSHESNIMRYCIFHYRIEDIMSRRKSRHIFNPIMKDTISHDITRVRTNSVFISSSFSKFCVIMFLKFIFKVLKGSNKFSVRRSCLPSVLNNFIFLFNVFFYSLFFFFSRIFKDNKRYFMLFPFLQIIWSNAYHRILFLTV
jgi:hypothetical protein